MTSRAIESWLAQTYRPCRLVILDTGLQPFEGAPFDTIYRHSTDWRGQKIGWLRNRANAIAIEAGAEILAHQDSDDISGSQRIESQVKILTENREVDVTGHREVVFWAEDKQEAWLYTERRQTFGIGGSLCYWAAHWKAHPFDNRLPSGRASTSEYYEFLKASKVYAVTSLTQMDPMLLCRIHAGNSSDYSFIWNPRLKQTTFYRAPSFDEICKSKFHV